MMFQGSKGGSSSFKQTPDNLRSNDTFEGVLGLCVGPIKGPKRGLKSIKLDDTAIENETNELNFQNFTANFADGDPLKFPQKVNLRLGAGASPVSVGSTLRNVGGNAPVWVTRTLNNTGADFVDLRFLAQQMFSQTKKGVFDITATIEIQMKPTGTSTWINPTIGTPTSTYQEQGLEGLDRVRQLLARNIFNQNGTWKATSPNYAINGKTTSPAVYELRIGLPNEGAYANTQWDIRCRLLERESYDADPNFEKRTISWESMAAVYGNTMGDSEGWRALAWLQIYGLASDQLNGVPEVSGEYDTKIVSVPASAVYNPTTRVYTAGVWDGSWAKAFTNDPAWVVNDAITDSLSGLSLIAQGSYLNKWDALDASKWFSAQVPDGNGGTEPRYSMNLAITEPQKAEEFIRYMAGAVGALVWDQGNGEWRMKVDKPETASDIFTLDNIEGQFVYSHTDVDTRFNDIIGQFKNAEMDYRQDAVRLYDNVSIAKLGRKPTTIPLIGCTGRQEAMRRVKLRLRAAANENKIVTFTTNRRGRNIEPLSTILIADGDMGDSDVRGQGRIVSIAADRKSITVRDTLRLEVGVSYTLNFAVPNPNYTPETTTQPTTATWDKPTVASTRNVTNTSAQRGNVTTIYLDTALPTTLDANANVSLSATGMATLPRMFRVTAVVPDDDGERVSISAINIDVDKWTSADNVTKEDTVFQDLRGAVPVPTTITGLPLLSLVTVPIEQGTQVNLRAAWVRPAGAFIAGFQVQYSINGGAMQPPVIQQTADWELVGPVGGTYTVEVRTRDRSGALSAPLVGVIEVSQQILAAPDIKYDGGETLEQLKPAEGGATNGMTDAEAANAAQLALALALAQQKIAEIEDSVGNVDVTELNQAVATLQGEVTTAKNNITSLTSSTSTLGTNVTTLQGQMTTAQGNITSLTSSTSTLNTNVTTLQGQMTTAQGNISTIQGSVGSLNTSVGTLNSNVGALQTQATGIISSVNGLDTRITAQGGQITTLQSTTSSQGASITTLQQTVSNTSGEVATLKTQINAGGGNLLSNTDLAIDTSGWAFVNSGSNGSVGDLISSGDQWMVPGESGLRVSQANGTTTGYSDWSQFIPVEAGKWYDVSVRLAAHRCAVVVYIQWWDTDGVAIASAPNVPVNSPMTGGANLINWTQVGFKAQAPATAVRGRMILRKMGTSSGANPASSYAWYIRPQIAETTATSASPLAYSAGNARATIQTQATAVSTLTTTVSTLSSTVSTQGGSITTLQQSVTSLTGSVSTLSSTVSTQGGSITTLQQSMTTAQGDLVTLRTQINAGGGNLLTNTDLANGSSTGWLFNSQNGAGAIGSVNSQPIEYQVAGENSLVIMQPNAVGSPAYAEWQQTIPVEAGKYYDVSGYYGAHRCTAQVYLQWVDASGASSLGAPNTGVLPLATSGNTLVSWPRYGFKALAPAGAVRGRLLLRKNPTTSGTDSWAWFIRPQIAETTETSASPLAYSPGSARASIVQQAQALSTLDGTLATVSSTVSTQGSSITSLQSSMSTTTGNLATLTSTITAQGVAVASLGPERYLTGDEETFSGGGSGAAAGPVASRPISKSNATLANWGPVWQTADLTAANSFNDWAVRTDYSAVTGRTYEIEGEFNVTVSTGTGNVTVQVRSLDSAGSSIGLVGLNSVANPALGRYILKGRVSSTGISGQVGAWTANAARIVPHIRANNTSGTLTVQMLRLKVTDVTNTAAVEASVSTQATAITTLTGQQATLSSTVTTQGANITSLQSAVSTAQGDVATLKTQVNAGGGNILTNTDLAVDTSGWTAGLQNSAVADRVPSGDQWVPLGENGLRIFQPNGTTTGYSEWEQFFPIEAGKWYDTSVRVAAHRCQVQVYISWRDTNNATISSPSSGLITPLTGGTLLGNWTHIGFSSLAPVNAVRARIVLRKFGTLSGASEPNSYAWWLRPQVAETRATSASPLAYTPGSARAVIESQASALSTATSSLASLSTTVSTQGGSITTLQSSYTSLSGSLSTLSSTVSTQGGSITTLQSSMTSAQGSISTLQSTVSTQGSNISTLQSTQSTQGTDVATLKTQVNAGGGNLLVNTDVGLDTSGWSFSTSHSGTWGRNLPGTGWSPPNESVLTAVQMNNTTTGQSDITQNVEVQAGKWYDASAYCASHRCVTQVIIQWLDTSGNALGAPATGGFGPSGGGNTLASFTIRSVKAQAPTGAVQARFYLRKQGTLSGNSDSYAWWLRPQFVECFAGTQSPVAYSPGSARASIVTQASALSTLNTSFSSLSTTVSTQGGSITTLQSSMTSAQGSISTLQSTVSTQGANITTLQSTTSTQTGQIGTLQSTVSTQGGSITTMQSTITTLQGTVSTLDTVVAASSSPNLVQNGGFENGLLGWTGGGVSPNTWAQNNWAWGYWVGHGGWTGSSGNNYAYMDSAEFGATNAAPFTLSFDYDFTGGAGCVCYGEYLWYDSNHALITSNGSTQVGPKGFDVTGYSRFKHTRTAPANTAFARVRVVFYAPTGVAIGSVNFRQVKMEFGSVATPYSGEATAGQTYQAYSTLNTSFATLSTTVSSQGGSISTLQSSYTSLNGTVNTLSSTVTSQGSSITSLQTTTSTQAGQIATLQTQVTAGGGNLLVNTDLGLDTAGWNFSTGHGGVGDRVGAGDQWVPPDENGLRVFQGNTTTTSQSDWVQTVAIEPGKWYDTSVYVASHRCDIQVYLQFRNAAGTAIDTPSTGRLGPAGGGNTISAYVRRSFKYQAPATAVRAQLYLRKFGTNAGSSEPNSFAWWLRPQVAECLATSASPVAYSPGSSRATISSQATALSTLNGSVSTLSTTVSTQGGYVSTLQASMTTAQGSISTLQSTVATQGANISTLQSTTSTTSGDVATLKTQITAGGGNLLTNTDASIDTSGWANGGTMTTGATFAINIAGDSYRPVPENVLAIQQSNGTTTGYQEYTQVVPVQPNKWYYASVFAASHRCTTAMYVQFLNSSGNVTGSGIGTTNSGAGTGGNNLSAFAIMAGKALAPADARSARYFLRKMSTNSGQSDSYAWFARPQLAETNADATSPPAYSAGSPKATISTQAQALSSLSGQYSSLSSTVGTLNSTVNVQQTAINNLNGKTTAYWQVEAVAGGRAQLKVYADANGGAGVDIIGDLRVTGNAIISGTVNPEALDLSRFVKRISGTGGGNPTAGQTLLLYAQDIGLTTANGSYLIELGGGFSTTVGSSVGTYNSKPYVQNHLPDGGLLIRVMKNGVAIYELTINASEFVSGSNTSLKYLSVARNIVIDSPGGGDASSGMATILIYAIRGNGDTGIVNDGDTYYRNYSATYSNFSISAKTKWTFI